MLKYADGFNAVDHFPNYFSTLHKLNTTASIQSFLDDGMLCIAPISYTLNKATIPHLKNYLTSKGLKCSGKKAEIVKRILENADTIELEQVFSERYYILTEYGKQILEANLTDSEYFDRFEPIIKGFSQTYEYVQKKQYKAAEQYMAKNGHSFVESHSEYQAYDKFFDYPLSIPDGITTVEYKAYIILYYMYGMRTESAIKDFKKKTNIDLSFSEMRKHLRIVQSLDELITAKQVAHNMRHGSFKYEYTIKTCNDEKVCESCQILSNKSFNVEKAIIGVNFPPLNACTCDYCRCLALFELIEKPKLSFPFFKSKK